MKPTAGWPGALEEIRRSAAPGGRDRTGHLTVEGTRLLERALRAGALPERVLVDETFGDDPRERALLEELGRLGCPVQVAPESVVRAEVGGRGHGEVLARVPLPRPADPGHLERASAPLLVACDLDDPGNVGALVRTTLACGSPALVAVGCTDPFHPKAVRTSMGALFKLPIARRRDPLAALEELNRHGFRQIACVSRGGEPPESLGAVTAPSALWVGGEAFGLPDEVLRRLEVRLSIPMHPGIDSFSVNAATAIALHACSRQASPPRMK